MSAALWLDVEADLESMVRHFGKAEEFYQRGGFPGEGLSDYFATMALLHAMQSGYTSAEAALLRILSILREQRPAGADWHSALIRRLARPLEQDLARPALLSAELAAAMQTARSFRHRAVHVYDDFDIERFPPALDAARTIVEKLPKQVAAFRKVMDG